jgi:phosphoserine phosphatase RsbU/P
MIKRKLLFVDDEPDFAQLVEQQFEGKVDGYDVSFVFAGNGLEALKKLEENQDIELVLIDIKMPVMDGLEFLDRATKLDRLLKIVMVSAYDDMPNLRKAMNRGAYDFIIKPVDFNDMAQTIIKAFKHIDRIKAEDIELKRLQEIEKEMEIAKKILSSVPPALLPSQFEHKNFEVFGTLVETFAKSGGFYDFFPANGNLLAIVIGETNAKGIAAAIYIASAREAIRKFIHQNPNLASCSKQINDYLFYQKTEHIPNCTLFIGLFDTSSGTLEYVSSGLPPLLFVSKQGEVTEQAGNSSLMGSLLDLSFPINTIRLHPHESLVIRSQGIQKIKDNRNQTYPADRLKQLVSTHHSQSADTLVNRITDDVNHFIQQAPLAHDYIVLCLKYK